MLIGILIVVLLKHVFFVSFLLAEKYRPLIMIRGISSDYKDMDGIIQWAKKDFPDMIAVSLDAFNDINSFKSLDDQIPS